MSTKSSRERELGTKISRDRESGVQEFLLQQHRTLLLRLSTIRIFNRVVFLVNIAFLILVNPLTTVQYSVSFSVSLLIALLWYFEQRALNVQLTGVEQTLAGRSGEGWEDDWIRSRYLEITGLKFLNAEPGLWVYIIAATILVRAVKG